MAPTNFPIEMTYADSIIHNIGTRFSTTLIVVVRASQTCFSIDRDPVVFLSLNVYP